MLLHRLLCAENILYNISPNALAIELSSMCPSNAKKNMYPEKKSVNFAFTIIRIKNALVYVSINIYSFAAEMPLLKGRQTMIHESLQPQR